MRSRSSGVIASWSQSYPIPRAHVISAVSRKCDGFQSANAAAASISRIARAAYFRSPLSRYASPSLETRSRHRRLWLSSRGPSSRCSTVAAPINFSASRRSLSYRSRLGPGDSTPFRSASNPSAPTTNSRGCAGRSVLRIGGIAFPASPSPAARLVPATHNTPAAADSNHAACSMTGSFALPNRRRAATGR